MLAAKRYMPNLSEAELPMSPTALYAMMGTPGAATSDARYCIVPLRPYLIFIECWIVLPQNLLVWMSYVD